MIKEFVPMKRWGYWVGKHFSFLSPMTWTWLSLVMAIVALFLVALQKVHWGFTLFLISALMDEIDGKVARYSDRATYIGGFTDGVVDRFVDFFMIFSFFFLELPQWGLDLSILLFTLLFATLLPPFIVAYANHRQAVPDPTERVIWRISFRLEYLILFLAGLFFQPIDATITLICIYLAALINWATVIQSLILTFIKAKDYEQHNHQASVAFHENLKVE